MARLNAYVNELLQETEKKVSNGRYRTKLIIVLTFQELKSILLSIILISFSKTDIDVHLMVFRYFV